MQEQRKRRTEKMEKLRTLINRQIQMGPTILLELLMYHEKKTHWIWWIYPTDKEGSNEPCPRTSVNKYTARILLEKAHPDWRTILELINHLIITKGIKNVLPPADHGRVKAFIPFWEKVLADMGKDGEHHWMANVLLTLKYTPL